MRCTRAVRRGFFPLDEELELLAGHYTPTLYEGMTRLSTWMPFERAVKEVGYFLHTPVTETTVRRQTETAGAAYVAVQTREVERLERELPPAAQGRAKLFMSVDGAFVPLVGGEWAEVKTLALGEVVPPLQVQGETVIQTRALSYFSRLTDSTTFQRLALVETHRRGLETAGAVGAVTDGAEWCQSFIDFHRPAATRILDFPHAGEHLAQIGQTVFGEGTPTMDTWFTQQLHDLKHDGPATVLTEIHHLIADHSDLTGLAEPVAYLDRRKDQMQYPVFEAAGWPIGDGAVESANKLVVETRLKGSGMHWARPHVDPMLALRNLACNDRWDEGWSHIMGELRRQTRLRSATRRQQRHARGEAPPALSQPTAPASSDVISQTEVALPATHRPTSPAKPVPDKPKEPWRPAPDHLWRRSPIGRARYQPTTHAKQ